MVTKTMAVDYIDIILIELIEKFDNKEHQVACDTLINFRNVVIEKAKEIERDNLILFGAQCMVESEKQSGLGVIKIYELYYNKNFNN